MQDMQIEKIFKRDFSQKPFELEKITDAILKAMISVKNGDVKDAETIATRVNDELVHRKKRAHPTLQMLKKFKI